MSNTISSPDNRKPAPDNNGLLDAPRGTDAPVLVPGLLEGAFTCACVYILLLVHWHIVSMMSAFTAPALPVFAFFLATIPMQMAFTVVKGMSRSGSMRKTRIAIGAIGIAFSLIVLGVAVSYLII